jgi:hypothetical protein
MRRHFAPERVNDNDQDRPARLSASQYPLITAAAAGNPTRRPYGMLALTLGGSEYLPKLVFTAASPDIFLIFTTFRKCGRPDFGPVAGNQAR